MHGGKRKNCGRKKGLNKTVISVNIDNDLLKFIEKFNLNNNRSEAICNIIRLYKKEVDRNIVK